MIENIWFGEFSIFGLEKSKAESSPMMSSKFTTPDAKTDAAKIVTTDASPRDFLISFTLQIINS